MGTTEVGDKTLTHGNHDNRTMVGLHDLKDNKLGLGVHFSWFCFVI